MGWSWLERGVVRQNAYDHPVLCTTIMPRTVRINVRYTSGERVVLALNQSCAAARAPVRAKSRPHLILLSGRNKSHPKNAEAGVYRKHQHGVHRRFETR